MAGYEKACRYIAFPTQGNVKTSLKRSYPVKKKEMCGVTTRKKITIKKIEMIIPHTGAILNCLFPVLHVPGPSPPPLQLASCWCWQAGVCHYLLISMLAQTAPGRSTSLCRSMSPAWPSQLPLPRQTGRLRGSPNRLTSLHLISLWSSKVKARGGGIWQNRSTESGGLTLWGAIALYCPHTHGTSFRAERFGEITELRMFRPILRLRFSMLFSF